MGGAHKAYKGMKAFDGSERPHLPDTKVLIRAAVTEFLAMLLFVYFGCGAAASNVKKDAAGEWEPASTAIIAFQFGLAITVLAYASAHSSGGHINCAVTWALCLVGKCHPVQGAAHFVAQMFGSVVGAVLLRLSIGDGKMDRTGGIGSNGLQGDYVGIGNAFIAETMGTISPGR